MNSRALRAGIDLGGTKIAGVVLDASGIEVCRERVATPQGDYQLTLQALVGLVATLECLARHRVRPALSRIQTPSA